MKEIIARGGPLMIPLILCSLIALAVIMERFYKLSKAEIDSEKFIDKVNEAIRKKDYENAVFLCETTPGPISALALSAVKHLKDPETDVRERMHESALKEISRLEKNISILGVCCNLAPLLGLLGTVTGMMDAFDVIAAKGIGQPTLLAQGISKALITTAAGLSIAIPGLIAFNFLQGKVDQIIHNMEEISVRLLNLIYRTTHFIKEQPVAVKDVQGEK